ncbi:MAG: transcription termination/antitermination protein NusA [Chloroflexi bacterium]|nr:transcription termination/antitermination protein NusA [Chloroflexota bacterium]
MARNDLIIAINQVCAERGLDPQIVIEAIEQALVSAYRKKFGGGQNVFAKIDTKTGEMKVFAELEVVERVKDPRTQISLEEARRHKPDVQLGDKIVIEATPKDFGRIAAQTAKQVMMQRIREAERALTYEELKKLEGEVVLGTIQRIDRKLGNQVVVNLGRGEGVLPRQEQIPRERYRQNDKMYFYVKAVEDSSRGPLAILSRTDVRFVRRLLEREVPEIRTGAVEIKSIAREPGARSKVAVAAVQPNVDPVGSCVGVRGTRIQAVVNALGGEKIDVVEWSKDPYKFIANALSPAKVIDVVLMEDDEEGRRALVIVPDEQLSLAIGKEGQNARLAAKLTGWRVDIRGEKEAAEAGLTPEERKRMRMRYAQQKADLLSQAEVFLREGAVEEVKAAAETPEAPAPQTPEEQPEAVEADAPDAGEEEEYMDVDDLDRMAMEQFMKAEDEQGER